MKILTFLIWLQLTSAAFCQYVPEWSQLASLADFNNGISYTTFDQNNNIYITGYKTTYIGSNQFDNVVTAKFSSAGILQWERLQTTGFMKYNYPAGIFCDNSGFIYVVGSSYEGYPNNNSKIFLYKYDGSGNLAGTYVTDIPGRVIRLKGSIFDNNSNIYINGYSRYITSTDLIDSVYTAKISTTGNLLWAKTYIGAGYQGNFGNKIKLDASGNIYTVCSINSGNGYLVFKTGLLKYSANGNLLWAQNHSFDPNLTEEPFDLEFDNNQNIYISGYKGRSGPGSDSSEIAVLKYNSNGVFQWGNTYNYSSYHLESGKKILIDNNNIYIFCQLPGSHRLLKLNQLGQTQWSNSYSINPTDIYFDNFHNIILSGTIPSYFRTELAIQKVSQAGTSDWQFNYTYNGTGTDKPHTLKLFNDNSIVMTGHHNNEILLGKLRPAVQNSILAVRNNVNKSINDFEYTYDTITFNLPANSFVTNVFVSIDSIIHPYVGNLDISLVHNNIEDTLIYRRGGPYANLINISLSDSCSLNICNSQAPVPGYYKPCKPLSQFISINAAGPWILKIWDRAASNTGTLKAWKLNIQYLYPIGITQISNQIPKSFLLNQNYPNPFNPETKIRFSIPQISPVKITVYDATGKTVETLVNDKLNAGTYETSFDGSKYSSGVYFYKLVTETYSETRKMILVK